MTPFGNPKTFADFSDEFRKLWHESNAEDIAKYKGIVKTSGKCVPMDTWQRRRVIANAHENLEHFQSQRYDDSQVELAWEVYTLGKIRREKLQ